MKSVSPWRVLLPVAVGTALSLAGDSSLYAVLPTNTMEAGVAVTSVGVILSANRFIRLALNGPAGIAYDRWRRRPLFVSALFIGALSTAIYGFTQGFWPLLLGRLLWGLAWSGIWVGGNTIVLDITRDDTRGRWVGRYQLAFFLGTSGGAMLGGILTDWLGYHSAMIVNATLTLLGAITALLLLPETRGMREMEDTTGESSTPASRVPEQARAAEFASATALYAANRLAVAGILSSTFGLFLLGQLGEQARIAGYTLGIATLTGMGLGLSRLISMAAAPYLGSLSDRASSRWRVAASGLVPGVAGFSLLSLGLPLATAFSVPLTAITAGSNQSLATALVGDLGNSGWQSRRLGLLYTVGDLASAVGPPLAYTLIPGIGIRNVYLLVALVLCAMLLVTLWRAGLARQRWAMAGGED
jgi:MFS family permease